MRTKNVELFVVLTLLFAASCQNSQHSEEHASFHKFYLEYGDAETPGWGWVRPGDIDSDGDIDLVAGGGRRLYVYENDGNSRGWTPHGNLDPTGEIGSNGCVLFDVDGDDDLDVVSSRYKIDPGWWENPGGKLSSVQWQYHPIDSGLDGWYAHDVILADLNGDGRQEEFIFNFNRGYWKAENRVYWYTPPDNPQREWARNVVVEGMKEHNHGHAGLDTADLDGDGRVDIVFSNGWFRAPQTPESSGWQWNLVSEVYGISNSLAADIDSDGKLDLVMAAGHHGRGVYWYRNTGEASSWQEYVVDSTVINPEGMQVLDFDHDGNLDILAAELYFGEAPGEPDWSDQAHSIYLYSNQGAINRGWDRSTISSRSYPAHGLLATDINLDGRLDLLGNGCGFSAISYYEGLSEPTGQQWWNESWRFRLPLAVDMNGYYREDKPTIVPLDLKRIANDLGLYGQLDIASLRLVEKDVGGNILDDLVPFQIDPGDTLTMICTGRTGPNTVRYYDLYFDTKDHNQSSITAASTDTLVQVTDGIMHEEQESFRIDTRSATYYYHKAGAGFASMEDRDGIDWLGYRPCCESAGQYRGIPNMWKFHPGQDSCITSVEINGPLRARIRSVAVDDSQECIWDIFPDYAQMTLLSMDKTYWFLYEGIPGGSLEVEHDYNMISNGLRRSIAEDWHGDLPDPEWIYFGDDRIERTIYLAHEDDDRTDQFWQMREEMVVFGFGREYRCCGTYMDKVPATFTVGFAEDSSYAAVGTVIDNAFQPVIINLGAPEKFGE